MRAMMIQGAAPESDVAFALKHANMVRNNSPTKANNGWTPREKEAGMRLPINQRLLKAPLFCLCFAHIYEAERHKHGRRAVACIYLGYDEASNTYIVRELGTSHAYHTADVTFHPHRFPYRDRPTNLEGYLHQDLGRDQLATYRDQRPEDLAPVIGEQIPSVTERDATPTRRTSMRERAPSHKAIQAAQANIGATTHDYRPSPGSKAYHNHEVNGEEASYFVHHFGPDPKTWDEAMAGPYKNEWIEARLTEKNSFDARDVYKLVPRSTALERGKKVFKPRLVLKMKLQPPSLQHPNGTIEKFRYRMTIAAFTKMLKQGIDYEEKFASTVRWNSLKVLMAIAVLHDFDIVVFDVSTFFLYGRLDEPVFMEQPEDWATADKPAGEFIWQLKGSMYGLPQAPNVAQKKFRKVLGKGGDFTPTKSDDCIYVSNKGEPYAATGTHVDDTVVVGDKEGIDKVRNKLTDGFDITEKRNPAVITGIQIERNREQRSLKAHQTDYTVDLLAQHGMTNCKGATTPMDPGTAKLLMMLPVDENPDPKVIHDYQVLVGGLMWLLKTREHLRFTVCLLSRFLSKATEKHLKIARDRPLRYLRQTQNHGLVFKAGRGEWILSGASDSDLAGDLVTSRSTMGHVLRLGEYGCVVGACGLERKLCTSTGDAETYAMMSMAKGTVWLRTLLEELHHGMNQSTLLRTDNAGVFTQSTKMVNHTAAKHYRISQAYIRQLVERGEIKVIKEDSDKNEADIYTKALGNAAYLRHARAIMGPQELFQ